MTRLLALFAAASVLFSSGAAQAADWLRAEGRGFVLYTDAGERDAREYLETLELFDHTLRRWHGLPSDEAPRRKLPIYLVRGQSDLRRVRPVRDSVGGFYTSSPDDTYAIATREGRDDRILLHEYVHHFMLQHFPYGYPAWLVEGYAEYFSTFNVKAGRYQIGLPDRARASWLANVGWIPMDALVTTHPAAFVRSSGAAMFYAQSWALTHWFMSDPARRRQLNVYLDALGRGEAPAKALETATGRTPAKLAAAVRSYLAEGVPYGSAPIEGFTRPEPRITRLPPSAAEVLLTTLRVKSDNGVDAPADLTDGPVLLAEARRVAARHPGDRAAELLLARAEAKLGDVAAGEAVLARRLSADPNDVEALQILTAAKLRVAEDAPPERERALRAEVRELAGRAHKLDPDSYPTLIAYARGRQGLPTYPTDNDVRVLLDAVELAPQVEVIRLNAARALAAKKQFAQAARILRPVALDPHGGRGAETARALIAAYETQAGAPSAPPPDAERGLDLQVQQLLGHGVGGLQHPQVGRERRLGADLLDDLLRQVGFRRWIAHPRRACGGGFEPGGRVRDPAERKG